MEKINRGAKFQGVIFDCDGTLIDTLGDISSSMNEALVSFGFPALKEEAYLSKVGWGIRKLAFLCLGEAAGDEALVAKVAARATEIYHAEPLKATKPYPGVTDLVAALREKGMKTAVLTNKPDAVAQLVIGGLFPGGSFDVVEGDAPGKPRKPDPAGALSIMARLRLAPGETVFAGDSEVDIETGLNAGCFPVGVAWGYRPKETIARAGARVIIDRPEELLEVVL
jgi:phosphoglycolate phosphatase